MFNTLQIRLLSFVKNNSQTQLVDSIHQSYVIYVFQEILRTFSLAGCWNLRSFGI